MIPDALKELNREGFARQRRAAVLEDEIAVLASHIHAATYRLIVKLRVFDELQGWNGWPSAAHWLQWRCGFSLNAAREKFRVARALPRLPLIRAAFKTGELSFAQVRAVTRIATPENEPTLLMWTRHSTASHMEKLARLYRRYGENAAAMAQHRERSFTHWEEDDGPPEHPDEDVSAETRRAREADAFVRVVESYLEPDGRARTTAEKYQVHVHLDLRQGADGPVEDPDAPALAEETLRRLGCEAGLVPVLHHGEEILSVGRKTRAVRPASPPASRGRLRPAGNRRRRPDFHAPEWQASPKRASAPRAEYRSRRGARTRPSPPRRFRGNASMPLGREAAGLWPGDRRAGRDSARQGLRCALGPVFPIKFRASHAILWN